LYSLLIVWNVKEKRWEQWENMVLRVVELQFCLQGHNDLDTDEKFKVNFRAMRSLLSKAEAQHADDIWKHGIMEALVRRP